MDITDVDVIQQVPNIDEDDSFVDKELLEALESSVVDQYKNFTDLGIDLLDKIDNELIKTAILVNFVDYISDEYLTIPNYEDMLNSTQMLLEIGGYLYRFVCVDGYNTIMPNLLKNYDIFSIDEFDYIFKYKMNNDPEKFKEAVSNCINDIIIKLKNLRNLDRKVSQDNNYLALLKNYTYYYELVRFSDSNLLLFNYFRPVLNKNFNEIIWRIL